MSWLGSLKAGDRVVVQSHDRHQCATRVERTTATRVFVDDRKFRRVDGKEVTGFDWGDGRLLRRRTGEQ
jgi:hypothetical protein